MPFSKMSAFRSHTCMFRTLGRFKPHKTYTRTFFAKSTQKHTVAILSIKSNAPLLSNLPCVCYSKETGSLTDEILRNRVETSDNKENEQDKNEEKKEEKKSGKWTGENGWRLGLISLGGMFSIIGGTIVYCWGAPIIDPGGNEIEDEFSKLPTFQQYLKRSWREVKQFRKGIVEPSREKLLPDPVQYPYYQPPYTLVIEMNDVMVHPDWTYGTGWRFKKRPHLEYFLQSVAAPLFEVVVYTQDSGMNADPILHTLDQKGYINYRLYRDATRYIDGHHVKDLGCLNRDLSKVIFIDWNEKSYALQPRNAFKLKRWTGNDEDRTLIDLANFLQVIASSKVEDVREVLDYYRNFEDPIEAFKENQRKLQAHMSGERFRLLGASCLFQEETQRMLQTKESNKIIPSTLGGSFFSRR